MSTEEDKYKEDLAKAGVDLPELEANKPGETPDPKVTPEPKKPEEKSEEEEDEPDSEPEGEEDDEEDSKSKQPTDKKPRSIYKDYKEKKNELKTERELRLTAEKELAELKEILAKGKKAETTEEKKDALDEFDEFAKEIDADPKALKRMRDLFLKGLEIPESLQKDLTEFKEWKAQQALESEKTRFSEEFTQTLPALKEFFPNANDKEMQAIRTEIDKIAHSDGWNDKSIKYIAFEHKDQLSALVSPKKRGMENLDRKDDEVTTTDDFDPNADLSTMTPEKRAKWETNYHKMMKKSEGLTQGPGGKKIII